MKSQKGSAAVRAIIVLVVIIIAGTAYWYLSQNPAQPTTARTPIQTQSTNQVNQHTNNASAPSQNSTSPTPHLVTVQNQNGQMTATPTTSNVWQFTFNGPFAEQQQSYVLDFGDGTQVSVQCKIMATNGQPVCNQLAPLTHTYTKAGMYQAKLSETFVGAGPGNEQMTTLLTLQVTN